MKNIILMVFVLTYTCVEAQKNHPNISGKVIVQKENRSEPVAGAFVHWEGIPSGVFTDNNGQLKKDLSPKINLTSTLNLFNNFTDVNEANRQNIDINWETMINMKLTSYLGVSIYTNLIHDNDVAVPIYEGNKVVGTGPRTQFKRLLGVGFSYKL